MTFSTPNSSIHCLKVSLLTSVGINTRAGTYSGVVRARDTLKDDGRFENVPEDNVYGGRIENIPENNMCSRSFQKRSWFVSPRT